MFNVNISGFKTKAQAEAFVSWYSGQGEQDAAVWFDCRLSDGEIDVDFMPVDCAATFPLKWDGNTLPAVITPMAPTKLD